MFQRCVNVLVLYISFGGSQTFIQIALAADMYYLEGLKQFWKYMAYRAVNGNRTETTADNKNDRAVGRQTGVFKPGKPIAL